MKDDGSLLKCRESENVTMTQREFVQAQRTAYAAGYLGSPRVMHPNVLDEVLVRRYPMPKVQRPRVVADPHGSGIAWRVVGRGVQWSGNSSEGGRAIWKCYPETHGGLVATIYATPERVAVWSSLYAQPLEEVEAE